MADDNTQADEQAEAPEAPEAEAPAVSEEPAKPAKRTRAKKAAEPVAEEVAAAAEDEAAPAAEKPAAKPARASRAKKAAEPVAEEAAEAAAVVEEEAAPAEAAKPKRTPRAKPLKKKAVPKERKAHVREPRPVKSEGRRKERRGIVVSAAMDKTITIRIDSAKPHPKYHKIVRRSTRLHAHDERNEAGVGDVVRIVETRPLSKLKRWRMIEIVEKAK